jgi:uncharacterized protein (DUF427 family)
MRPQPIPPSPGQESVWDYPRPPRLEPVGQRIRIEFNGETIADTVRAFRVLETSHPPVYYLPPDDIRMDLLTPETVATHCEWKGAASYFNVRVGDRSVERAAWTYLNPDDGFEPIAGRLAFYAGPMDACWVGDERAEPQPGGFYGGWITPSVVGPFKGGPGSSSW